MKYKKSFLEKYFLSLLVQERPGPGFPKSGPIHAAMQERGRLGAHPGTGPTAGIPPPPPVRTVEKEWRDRVIFFTKNEPKFKFNFEPNSDKNTYWEHQKQINNLLSL